MTALSQWESRDMPVTDEKASRNVPQWTKGNYEINWLAVTVLAVPPIAVFVAILAGVPLLAKTLVVAAFFYVFNGMIGITFGYHRLFSHRSFIAHPILQWICAFAGAGAFEGSAKWWGRNHRIHHRYVDTPKDPYDATRGFFFSHMGWMIMKQDYALLGKVDVSDFRYNNIIQFQHRHFFKIAMVSGIILPTLICGLGWGDWLGGYFYAGLAKVVFVHHCTFFINSLAHKGWLGAVQNYSDRHTSHDSFVCALLTFGEGYHNFHHEFAQDYRNGIKWYHFDPTKWTIRLCEFLRLATHLVRTPNDVIERNVKKLLYSKLGRQLGLLEEQLKELELPTTEEYTWDDIARLVRQGQKLTVIDDSVVDLQRSVPTGPGYTHSDEKIVWYDAHPGGKKMLDMFVGKDATRVFYGGIYKHSLGAEGLIPHLRIAKLKRQ
ncbi:putative fatty acid desaturase [Trypanosoma rangeli]|uniref:Putative fatty acid desaturase n=1 Tax=Trypanosoma rangeli TaxID=5698 RepID=A0A3R7MEL0_TRYRA|nr:putative fatty acid desaturase [Trypanosoma rangeli]RNF01109.1 putative fatty acid desaturase [Trypanosoma rangeli]|eukprot:RNF01109.1 putative fatty acid desaturase [Trypanosoma rangeli]